MNRTISSSQNQPRLRHQVAILVGVVCLGIAGGVGLIKATDSGGTAPAPEPAAMVLPDVPSYDTIVYLVGSEEQADAVDAILTMEGDSLFVPYRIEVAAGENESAVMDRIDGQRAKGANVQVVDMRGYEPVATFATPQTDGATLGADAIDCGLLDEHAQDMLAGQGLCTGTPRQ